jgi:hypothetical protein
MNSKYSFISEIISSEIIKLIKAFCSVPSYVQLMDAQTALSVLPSQFTFWHLFRIKLWAYKVVCVKINFVSYVELLLSTKFIC